MEKLSFLLLRDDERIIFLLCVKKCKKIFIR